MMEKRYKINELKGFDAMNATAQYLSMITLGNYSLKLMSLIHEDLCENGALEDAPIAQRLACAIGKFRDLKNDDSEKFIIFCDLLSLSNRENADYRYLYLNVCSDLNNIEISASNENNFSGAELVDMAFNVFCKICDDVHNVFFYQKAK